MEVYHFGDLDFRLLKLGFKPFHYHVEFLIPQLELYLSL